MCTYLQIIIDYFNDLIIRCDQHATPPCDFKYVIMPTGYEKKQPYQPEYIIKIYHQILPFNFMRKCIVVRRKTN